MNKNFMAMLNLILAGTLLVCAFLTYKQNLNKTLPSSVPSVSERINNATAKKKSSLAEIIECIKLQENLSITKMSVDNGSEKYFEIELVYEGTINSLREILNNINRECCVDKIESIEMRPVNSIFRHTIKMRFNRG